MIEAILGAIGEAVIHFFGKVLREIKERRREARDRKRMKQNRCVACNYDLQGNVSGRCPECGRRIEGRAHR